MPLRSILTFRSDLTFIPDNKGENGIDSKKPNCITLRPHEQHMSGLTEIASLYTTTVYHLALLGRPLDWAQNEDPSTSCLVRTVEGDSWILYREEVRERELAGVAQCQKHPHKCILQS